MNQHFQNIFVITDIIFTVVLVFYFAFRSMAKEYKEKWLSVMNGSGSKDWFNEKGWSYLRKSGFSLLWGTIILILIFVLPWILAKH